MDYRTVKAKARRPTERQRKAAEGLAAGKTVMQAMTEAGYTEATARQGYTAVPAVVQVLAEKASDCYKAGKGLTLSDLEAIAIGRLAINVTEGKDGGTLSAKVIGSHKGLNLWQPENQTGVIVINTPTIDNSPKELPKEE